MLLCCCWCWWFVVVYDDYVVVDDNNVAVVVYDDVNVVDAFVANVYDVKSVVNIPYTFKQFLLYAIILVMW